MTITAIGPLAAAGAAEGRWESRERAMWAEVINTALADACGAPTALSGHTSRRALIHDARVWFELGGGDFSEVCHLAGLDPEVVQQGALRAIARADAEAAGKRRRRA